MLDNLLVFGLNSTKQYSENIAKNLDIELGSHEEKYFEDGEAYVRPTINVRGRDVFVIQSLYADDNENINAKFVKLLMFTGALKDASAKRISLVMPQMIFGRSDRKTESRSPIGTKYVAQLIESVGADRVLSIDVHNLSAVQNAFRIPIDNLENKNLHADWCAERLSDCKQNITILSPDSGGYARAVRFRNALVKRLRRPIDVAIFDKLRRTDGELDGDRIVGTVADSQVIIYDDIISTAKTTYKAYKAVIKNKGTVFAICASHGLFVGEANDFVEKMETNIVVSDTIPPFRLNDNNLRKINIVETTKMIADAIIRIHSGTGSISDLLK